MGATVISPYWQGLLQALAILAIFVPVWTHGLDWIDGKGRAYRESFGIILSGTGVLLLMLFPFELLPGMRIDLRCSLIIVAGFLGSPLIGAVTGGIAAAVRIFFGGVGETAGVISIVLSTVLGIAGRLLLRGRPVTIVDILAMAAASSLAAASGLVVLPSTLFDAGLPLAAMAFVATAFAGLAVLDADRRRDTARTNQFYRSIIDALPEPLNAKDLQGRFVAANPATARQLGAPDVAAVLGKTDFDFHPLEAAREYRADEERVLAEGDPDTIEQALIRSDGSRTWLSTLKSPLRDSTGAITGLLTHNRDVTERKHLEDAVEDGRRRLNDAMEHMADGLVMFDKDARLVLCNDQYRTMFPATADLRVPGARLADILRASVERGEQVDIPPDQVEAWISDIGATFAQPGETDIHLGDGRWLSARVRPTADGGALTVMTDITATKLAEATLTELNQRLADLAREDALTGLMNRRGYDEALKRAFAQSRRTGLPLSLLLIDVDHFKAYNDTYGHPAGDGCLRQIGRLLKDTVRRPGDATARYGGEEFAAILADTPEAGAIQVAEALRRAVRALSLEHDGSQVGMVTVSIGVATAIAGGDIPRQDDLTRRADAALYAAKAQGRDRVVVAEARQLDRRLAVAS